MASKIPPKPQVLYSVVESDTRAATCFLFGGNLARSSRPLNLLKLESVGALPNFHVAPIHPRAPFPFSQAVFQFLPKPSTIVYVSSLFQSLFL